MLILKNRNLNGHPVNCPITELMFFIKGTKRPCCVLPHFEASKQFIVNHQFVLSHVDTRGRVKYLLLNYFWFDNHFQITDTPFYIETPYFNLMAVASFIRDNYSLSGVKELCVNNQATINKPIYLHIESSM